MCEYEEKYTVDLCFGSPNMISVFTFKTLCISVPNPFFCA